MADKNDYEVGFGKPPKNTQFPKGKSGNPNGRPKNNQDIEETFKEISKKTIKIKDGNSVKEVSTYEAMLMALLEKAMTGDPPAFNTVMDLALKAGLLPESKISIKQENQKFFRVPDMETIENWERQAIPQQEELIRLTFESAMLNEGD